MEICVVVSFVVLGLLSTFVACEYDCMCNYSVERAVYPSARTSGSPIGYVYQFDCKPMATTPINKDDKVVSIQFEKKLGYVRRDDVQVRIQTCPGNPPAADLILPKMTVSSTTMPTSTSTTTSTATIPTTATTTIPSTTTKPATTTRIATTILPTTISTTTSSTTSTTSATTTPVTRTTTHTTMPTTPSTTTSTTSTTSTPTTTTSTTSSTTSTTTTPTTTTSTTSSTTTTPITTTSTTSSTTTPDPTTETPTQPQTMGTTPSLPPAAHVSGTPYQYVGIGYNILTGYPNTAIDPGFLTTQRIFQFTGNSTKIREATYDKHTSCTSEKNTMLLYGSKSYQDELKHFVHPSSNHNAHLTDAAFTYNSKFNGLRHSLDSTSGHYVYLQTITSCNLGNVRYVTENASSEHFAVSSEFAKDICALPMALNSNSIPAYMHFLDKWGTSIVTSVEMGTKTIESYQTTPVNVFQHVQQTDPNLLEHGGPYQGFASSITINTHDYSNSKAGSAKGLHGTFGARHLVRLGTPSHPVPIAAEVVPILNALDWKYWKPIVDKLVSEGACTGSIYGSGLGKYAFTLKMALSQYPGYKDTATGNINAHRQLLDRHNIHVPVTWPVGTYGLMKTRHGCPADNVRWQEGYRKQDTEDLNARSLFTPGIYNYLSGVFQSNDVTTKFCMKTNTHSMTGSQYDQQWPKGQYCLLKLGFCPSGFATGYIAWDDEDLNNSNDKGGVLPDGAYDSNTKIYYCCRHDGSPSTAIILPTDRPFALVRYGNTCQTVYGMTVIGIFIRWDDEDSNNSDRAGGVHPLDDGGTKDHKLHFCYYQQGSGPAIIG